jgi:hypothetical protein
MAGHDAWIGVLHWLPYREKRFRGEHLGFIERSALQFFCMFYQPHFRIILKLARLLSKHTIAALFPAVLFFTSSMNPLGMWTQRAREEIQTTG